MARTEGLEWWITQGCGREVDGLRSSRKECLMASVQRRAVLWGWVIDYKVFRMLIAEVWLWYKQRSMRVWQVECRLDCTGKRLCEHQCLRECLGKWTYRSCDLFNAYVCEETNLYLGRVVNKKIPAGMRFFAHVQADPGAHPASCTMGTGSFPGVKRPGRGADHPPPSSAEVRKG
jgi:hypothetical protein